MSVSEVLRIAAAEIGYNRWDDPEPGTKCGRDYATRHGAYFATSGVPYCAMFVTWVLRQAGVRIPGGDFAYVPYGINAARNEGRLIPARQARPGDLAAFDWDGDGVADHVGVVEANRWSHLQTIEGNTSSGAHGSQSNGGGVYRRTRSFDEVAAVWRPYYDEAPASRAAERPAIGLEADGYWGEATTRLLQEVLGTPVDGAVSSQDSTWREQNPGLTSGWEWTDAPEGSLVIDALQRRLGVKADGLVGPGTFRALQSYLGTPVDGVVSEGSAMVMALQQRLNEGRF